MDARRIDASGSAEPMSGYDPDLKDKGIAELMLRVRDVIRTLAKRTCKAICGAPKVLEGTQDTDGTGHRGQGATLFYLNSRSFSLTCGWRY